jgi:hypothetical protein
LPGALTGAATGFHLYFLRPGLNTDTVAPVIFAGVWAFCAMLAGALITSLASWFVERGLQRGLSVRPWVAGGLALLCVIGLCRWVYAPLQAHLPSLIWASPQTEQSGPPNSSGPNCAEEPPPNHVNRKLWEQECR